LPLRGYFSGGIARTLCRKVPILGAPSIAASGKTADSRSCGDRQIQ
jgi:hypothetical protein